MGDFGERNWGIPVGAVCRKPGVNSTDENGLLGQLTKLLPEQEPEGEITNQLGCRKHKGAESAKNRRKSKLESRNLAKME